MNTGISPVSILSLQAEIVRQARRLSYVSLGLGFWTGISGRGNG